MQKTANCTWNYIPVPATVACLAPGHESPQIRDGRQLKQQGVLRVPAQMLRIMRMTTLIMLIFCVHVSARTSSQTITLTGKDLSLKEIFTTIEQQTGFLVWGKSDFLKDARPVSLSVRQMPLTDFLDQVMKDQPFTYKITDNTIILSQKLTVVLKPGVTVKLGLDAMPVFANISGFIQNAETKEAIAGASVSIKGSATGLSTDNSGGFSLTVPDNAIIVVSSIGYNSIEIPVGSLVRISPAQPMTMKNGSVQRLPNGVFLFFLSRIQQNLDEIVINTGISKRSSQSFTGSATTFSGDQLKAIGNKNVLESLKTLDPSFIKVDDNLQGSNPNRLPTLEIRGKTTLTNANLNDQFNSDPNQPLFILDGFETTLQVIYDLDMNRIASITLLKDAASTALYGSKAANGVVVVETKRPVPGKLQGSYVGDFSFDLPDLSSYNLMDAKENLLWEQLTTGYITSSPQAWKQEERNSARRADVERGVNTYWLNEPVHVGFTNKHSLQLNGGNNDLLFNAGGSYSNQAGVMKGSKRENWGGNFSLTYRKGRLNLTEMATVLGNTGTESPYGAFSTFAAANPYYRKTNEDGSISKLLDPVYDTAAINPLYNASLFSINQSKTFSFINNIRAIYTLSNSIRLEGGVQLTKGNTNAVIFIPPDNTTFAGVIATQKGRYTNNHSETHGYTGNLTVAWGTTVGKNQFSAIVRGQVQNTNSESLGFSVVGYPYGTNGNPAFAYGFTPYSTPSSFKVNTRGVSLTSSVSYSFDGRFMLDGVYTLNGTSAFGSNKRYKPFISGGLGWNLKREAFFRDLNWMNLLKFRGNIGYSGNENLGNFTSVSTYSYVGGNNNNFSQGLSLASLGNPNLDWSKTLQGSYGLDLSFLNSRITGTVEYFRKKTDPLAVGASGTLPSSVAVNNSYVINVGTLTTKGWNFNLRYSPIYDLRNRIIWSVGVSGVKTNSVYGGMTNRLSALNKQEQDSKGLERYYDGYSPEDMWAVVSRGIDPANGYELFQKQNGTITYIYDPADIVRVGNTRPKLEGIINTSFTYKDFTFGANARYRIGGYVFNSALYSKVENTGAALYIGGVRPNIDRRALYDRWQKPGDVSEFLSIKASGGVPMSSRFVQKDSHFIGESFNISWRSSAGWIRKMRLQSLGVNLYLNDIFRIETVQTERGLDYPFSRAGAFSVNVSF